MHPGIGAACAKALAQSGATICLAVRPPTKDQPIEPPSFISHTLREIHASLQNPSIPAPDVHVLPCDLASSEDVKALVPLALERMGSIDILVNCAGIQRRAKAEEFSEQDWDDVSLFLFLILFSLRFLSFFIFCFLSLCLFYSFFVSCSNTCLDSRLRPNFLLIAELWPGYIRFRISDAGDGLRTCARGVGGVDFS